MPRAALSVTAVRGVGQTSVGRARWASGRAQAGVPVLLSESGRGLIKRNRPPLSARLAAVIGARLQVLASECARVQRLIAGELTQPRGLCLVQEWRRGLSCRMTVDPSRAER